MQNSKDEMLGGVLVLAGLAWFFWSGAGDPDTNPITQSPIAEEVRPLGTDELVTLIQIVDYHRQAFRNAENRAVEGLIRRQRGEALCEAFSSRFFEDWVGGISEVWTSGDGQAITRIAIDLSPRRGASSLTIVDTTSHRPGSDLHNTMLSGIKAGDQVMVTGELIFDTAGRVSDCFREQRLTLRAGMLRPAYSVRITSLEPLTGD